mmetsp:Transcript_25603/g.36085  ORF Transcript_25603/g.36085 Transcript_25603/m.36085 type:complete len:472 (+) Transcript_25603:27-1442(+)
MMFRVTGVVLALICHTTEAFVFPSQPCSKAKQVSKDTTSLMVTRHEDNESAEGENQHQQQSSGFLTRRDALKFGAVVGTTLTSFADTSFAAGENDAFSPAKRATAYRVDTTIPPTLLPLDARKETSILKGLGKGSGTSKDAIFDDSVNLNNLLQKIVYGTADAVSSVVNPQPEVSKSGPGYASFVCLGVPADTSSTDIDLSLSLLSPIVQPRKSTNLDTALGLTIAPLSTQSALDAYVQGGQSELDLLDVLAKAGVLESASQLYLPLMQFAKQNSLKLLAMAPEVDDVKTVRSEGLQNVDVSRRSQYVVDAEGFIQQTQDPKFRLFTERSLLKDFNPVDEKDGNQGNYFAERILVHETAASIAASYAAKRPESLVALVAPTPDLRFLGGINGRIPRICNFLNKEDNKVNDDAVTTILLNPTAKETLSKSRYIRLEIGTAPENWTYQSKVADYLWFSTVPKVNMIPRLMNPR